MIENDDQLRITKVWRDKFKAALAQGPDDLSLLTKAHRDGLASQIEEFDRDIAAYERRHG